MFGCPINRIFEEEKIYQFADPCEGNLFFFHAKHWDVRLIGHLNIYCRKLYWTRRCLFCIAVRSLSLPEWCSAFQPFHPPFLFHSDTHCPAMDTHPSSFLVCSLPISHRDARHFSFEGTENNVWLHCVRPVIGVIVWKVRWQLDLKRAITSNPTTPLMASLSSSIVSTSPPTLSSPSFSANQCSWPHHHHHVCLLPHRRTRTIQLMAKRSRAE